MTGIEADREGREEEGALICHLEFRGRSHGGLLESKAAGEGAT